MTKKYIINYFRESWYWIPITLNIQQFNKVILTLQRWLPCTKIGKVDSYNNWPKNTTKNYWHSCEINYFERFELPGGELVT